MDGEALAQSCAVNYDVTFPILEKCEVNGPNTHPVLANLKEQRPTGGLLGMLSFNRIKWNYEKFLVDREGRVVQRYAPTTSPMAMVPDIERLLKEQPVPGGAAAAAAAAAGGGG
jgi:glutathione peroxidase-family protein